MRRTRFVVIAIVLLAAAAGAAVAISRDQTRTASVPPALTQNITCRSPSLGGTLPAVAYLPSGYRAGTKHYPVIYFLHGLPAGPTAYQNNQFVAASVEKAGRRAIVVAPQGARGANSDPEYLNWSPTENWPKAIASDLTRCIDARFRTIPNRHGRALVGLSAGGFGAFNIGLRNFATFGAVESWSGYFAATDPAGWHVLDLGSKDANRRARVPKPHDIDDELKAYPTYIAFYVGRQDSRFYAANLDLDAAFRKEGIPHLFRVYPGGHSASLWTSQAPAWLGRALDHLAPPG